MTDTGDKLLNLVPAFVGLAVASKFLDNATKKDKTKKLSFDKIF